MWLSTTTNLINLDNLDYISTEEDGTLLFYFAYRTHPLRLETPNLEAAWQLLTDKVCKNHVVANAEPEPI